MVPLLSIITPVFNVESYLDRCVQSIVLHCYSLFSLSLPLKVTTISSLSHVLREKFPQKE